MKRKRKKKGFGRGEGTAQKKREEKKKKREEETKKKAEEKAQKAAEKATQRAQRVTGRKRSARSLPLSLKTKKIYTNPEVNENECCTCFGMYDKDMEEGNGREWLNCTCGRWLHDDCVSNEVDLEEDATICLTCRSMKNA